MSTDCAVDKEALAAFLADALRLVSVELRPLDVACAWPVYKGVAYGRAPFFVKLTTFEAAARAMDFLESADSPLLPKPLLGGMPEFGSYSVLVLEWKPSVRVNAEDLSDAQLDGFLEGCLRLRAALDAYCGADLSPAEEDSPVRQYDALQRYALRHRLVGRLLRPLLRVPEPERTYGGRPLVTIHGDLQPKNYGFEGDRLAAVYDTDDLTRGLACEDAAYAFTERARRAELSSESRRRLADLFRRLVARSPWPRDEWTVAVNHARLRIAARRLAKHPDSPFVAFDIARRDKPLRALLAALEEPHA